MTTKTGKTSGLTFIELLVTSAIVSIMLVGSMNVLSRVFRNITSTMQKNHSLNIASEKLDYYRQFSFNSLQVTDDQYLPMPYHKLKTCPKCYEQVSAGNNTYDVYSYVQWAEDTDKGVEGRKKSELGYNYDYKMKKISVVVVYTANEIEKISKMSTYMTEKEQPVSGSIIRGRIYKNKAGTVTGPGLYSGSHILLQNFPQYMTRIIDNDGNYEVRDVAPGSYNLFGRGTGLVTTAYPGNPLVITSIPATYSDINITCNAVDAGGVSGNVYWSASDETVTATPTPVPYCPKSKVLYATGAMAGRPTPQWLTFTKISAYDGTADALCDPCNSDTRDNTTYQRGYSEFSDATPVPNSGICEVVLKIKVNCWACSADIGFNFTKDSGATWANTGANTWSGGAPTPVVTYSIPNVYLDVESAIPITHLYSQWDWAKVNSLGVLINGGYNYNVMAGFTNVEHLSLDYVRIDVSYYEGTPPPTFTPTPVWSATPSVFPCAYSAQVAAMDGVSQPYKTSNSDCRYNITAIDVSSNTLTSIIAFKERASDGTSYFKRLDNVPVALGTVTYRDIMLEPASNTPAVFGVVRDAVTNAPIIGANVMMNDPDASNTFTAGGGSYFLMPVTEGTYTLKATLSGYTTLNPVTQHWNKGIIKAPDLMMQPIGSISGIVTDETTGNPSADIDIQALDPAGNAIGTARSSSTGYYIIEGLFAGQSYKLEPVLDPDKARVTYPVKGFHTSVPVNTGVNTPDKNFKVQELYGTISGMVQVDGTNIQEGSVVLAYPSYVTIRANDFKVNNANPGAKKHGNRSRIDSPYYGDITGTDAKFEISVPAGQTYNLYAFYSFVSYTGKAKNPNKAVKKYYKTRTNVPANSTDQDITGALGTWTSY